MEVWYILRMTQAELKKLEPKIKAYVEVAVATALDERLGDPDAGLELRESFKRVLRARERVPKKKYFTLEQVTRDLGIE